MNKQLTPIDKISTAMTVRKVDIEAALAGRITFDKFETILRTAIVTSSDYVRSNLYKCDPQSIVNAAVQCAGDGLMPDSNEACIIPYAGEASYMPMIRGIYKTLHRSGKIDAIDANVVHENDEFDFQLGSNPYVKFKPNIDGDQGKFRCVYALIKLKDGGTYIEIMTHAEVEKVKSVSKGKLTNGSPWVKWYNQMAIKSCIHRLAKTIYVDDTFSQIMLRDHNHYDFNQKQETQPRERTPKQHKSNQANTAPQAKKDHVEDAEVLEDKPASKAEQRELYATLQAAIDSCDTHDLLASFMKLKRDKIFSLSDKSWQKGLIERYIKRGIQVSTCMSDLNGFNVDTSRAFNFLNAPEKKDIEKQFGNKMSDLSQAPAPSDEDIPNHMQGMPGEELHKDYEATV